MIQKYVYYNFSKYEEQITAQYDDLGMRCERDAFDTLFDHAPDKLAVVKKVTADEDSHLIKIN